MAESDPYEEAERLIREAAREVPPGGWAPPGAARGGGTFPDLGQLAALVESLRGVVPPELARQLADALRELLIALRAVLDWYIARLEPTEPPEREVRDIPVD